MYLCSCMYVYKSVCVGLCLRARICERAGMNEYETRKFMLIYMWLCELLNVMRERVMAAGTSPICVPIFYLGKDG